MDRASLLFPCRHPHRTRVYAFDNVVGDTCTGYRLSVCCDVCHEVLFQAKSEPLPEGVETYYIHQLASHMPGINEE